MGNYTLSQIFMTQGLLQIPFTLLIKWFKQHIILLYRLEILIFKIISPIKLSWPLELLSNPLRLSKNLNSSILTLKSPYLPYLSVIWSIPSKTPSNLLSTVSISLHHQLNLISNWTIKQLTNGQNPVLTSLRAWVM